MATLVTGGAGFIGSHLVDRLIGDGDVIVFDNLITGRLANLESAIKTERAIFVYADVAQHVDGLDALYREATSEKLDAIYHLASPASPTAYGEHPWETLAVNGHGTMQLLELAKRHGARFLFASTSEVYGDPLVHPQPESYFGNVNPVGPRSCYDEGKRFGEAAVTAAAATFGIDARIVRIFNCYGPRMAFGDGRLVPELIAAAHAGAAFPIHGDGSQTRSLTFVSDLVDGLLAVARAPIGAAPVNLGSEEERSVAEIVEAFARVSRSTLPPARLPVRPEDPQRRKPVIDRARALGWSPTVPLEDGLRETLAWFEVAVRAYALT
jgi:nucleoside-diphosphate-sugar epimerase